MDPDVKSCLEQVLEKNDLITDLTTFKIDEPMLVYVHEQVAINTNILCIKWNEMSKAQELPVSCRKLIENIERSLVENNKIHDTFPADSTFCILTKLMYTYKTSEQTELKKKKTKNGEKNDEDDGSNETEKFVRMFDKLTKQEWKIKDISIENSYKSILFINKKSKQLILAFQGIKFDMKSFFTSDPSNQQQQQSDSLIGEYIGNLDISYHTMLAFHHTTKAVALSKAIGYSLSFTGYSFGAWLAEQSVYFCHTKLEHKDVLAVTFNSPGSRDYLEKLDPTFNLDNLNVITYLTQPNFVNTCNRHLGRVYVIFTSETNEQTNKFFHETIQKIPIESLSKLLRKCYNRKIKTKLDEYSFFLNGIRAFFADGLDLIVNEFDESTDKPKSYKKVLAWPRVEIQTKNGFDLNAQNHQFDFEKSFDLLNLNKVPINESIDKQWRKSLSSRMDKKIFEDISNHSLSNIILVINFLIEIIKGNLSDNQCLKSLRYGSTNGSIEYPTTNGSEVVFDKENFTLNVNTQYKVERLNLFKETIEHFEKDTIEYYMWRLKLVKKFTNLDNRQLEKLLANVAHLYDIENSNGQNYIIKTSSKGKNVRIPKVKSMLERILSVDRTVKSFLENPDERIEKSIESNQFGGFRLTYFTGRAKEMSLIDKNFVDNNIAVIEGESGCGKTTLALEYAYKKNANDSSCLVKFLNSSTLLSELEVIGKDLKVYKKDSKNVLEFINNLTNEINKFAEEKMVTFIFIIDNVTEKDLLVKQLIFGLDERSKILITTKYTNLNESFFTLVLTPFDFVDFNEMLENKDSISLTNSEKEVFASMGFKRGMKVSPLKLNRVLTRLKKNGNSWKFENMRSLLEREENRFRLIKNEFSLSFEVLNILAYLNGQNVSFELLKSIFISENDDLIRALDYLVKHGEICVNQRGEYSINEISQYEFKKLAHFSVSIEDLFERIVLALNSLIFEDDLSVNNLNEKTLNLINQSKHVLKYETRMKSSNKNVNELLKKIGLVNEEYFQKSSQTSPNAFFNKQKSNKLQRTANATSPSDRAKELIQMSYENEKICNYKSAIANLNEAIEIYSEILPSNHPTLSHLLNDLAAMQVIFGGDYEEALKNHNRALEILNRLTPVDQILKANTLFGIANAFNYQGNYNEALKHYKEVLDIEKSILPETHPNIGKTLNNMANAYKNQGLYDEAEAKYREALDIYGHSLSKNDPIIADTLYGIAGVYALKSKFSDALLTYNQVLDFYRESLPSNHPYIAQTLHNIGSIYEYQGKLNEALDKYDESLGIKIKKLPQNHPSTNCTIKNIRSVKTRLNRNA